MGRRSEHRIAACLPVVVYGVDDRGNPFTQTATTVNVSASGALLQGLECVGRPGTTIAIEHEDRKALFRVLWIGEEGSARAGQIGVQCLDAGKFIWGVKLAATTPDQYDGPRASKAVAPLPFLVSPVSPTTVPWAGTERRQFSRLACRLESQVKTPDASTHIAAKVIDICLGGCYLEMMSPLPINSSVEIVIELGDSTISARGKVCTTHQGIGMGVSFTGMRPADLKKLRALAPPGQGAPEIPPAMSLISEVTPEIPRELAPVAVASVVVVAAGAKTKAQPSAAEALEAVVRVLFRKGIMDRTELFDEIERLKARRN
jgi:hypothetical protein